MRLAEALERRWGELPADLRAELTRASDDEAAARAVAAGIPPARLAQAWADAWALPYLEALPAEAVDPALVERLPVEWVRARGLLPVRWNGRLCAAACDPRDPAAQEDLARMLGEDLELILIPPEALQRATDACYSLRREEPVRTAAPAAAAETVPDTTPSARMLPEDLLRGAEGAPVSRWVNQLLLDAVQARASDIHIEPGDDAVRVRVRVDGLLYDRPPAPKAVEAALVSRVKVMARLDIAEKRLPQDGMARVRMGAREMDVRVSTVPAANGERMVLRLLNHESALLPLGELGLPGGPADRFREWLRSPRGLILVTGPTGSGKTTTLYAALRELDTKRLNVLTIEDPIEYQLPGIGQIQVNPKIGLTFARCLRHVLRQDPDVIFVGETRDLETAEIALRASMTGHLVFTTLHTNDAASAALRLADMGVEPYLLSASLRGVIAQRLVRRLCPACRIAGVMTAEDLAPWGARARPWIGQPHARAHGCDRCLEGYHSRIGLFELLEADAAVAEAIHDRRRPAELATAARAGGHRSLWEHGMDRVVAGETSLAELQRALGGAG
jgi:general secretion pathway protein E